MSSSTVSDDECSEVNVLLCVLHGKDLVVVNKNMVFDAETMIDSAAAWSAGQDRESSGTSRWICCRFRKRFDEGGSVSSRFLEPQSPLDKDEVYRQHSGSAGSASRSTGTSDQTQVLSRTVVRT